MINFYTQRDFEDCKARFSQLATTDLKSLRELKSDDHKRSHLGSSVLCSLGLQYDTVTKFLEYVDALIGLHIVTRPDGKEAAITIANELKEKFIEVVSSVEKPDNGFPKDSVLHEPTNPLDGDTRDYIKSDEPEIDLAWTDAKKTHIACGIFKYIYELNQARLIAAGANQTQIPQVDFKDLQNSTWKTASLSFTGTHTHAVNCDRVLAIKANMSNRVLAAVADGVSCPTLPNSPPEPDAIEYSAATAAQGVIQALAKFEPSIDFTAKQVMDLDAQALATREKIFNKPISFLRKLRTTYLLYLAQEMTLARLPSDQVGNFRELIQWIITNKDVQKSFAKENGYNNLSEVLQDNDILKRLAIAETSLYCARSLLDHFKETHTGIYTDGLSAETELSFALDLGEEIAFVAQGDSPILVFGHNDKLIHNLGWSNSGVITNVYRVDQRTTEEGCSGHYVREDLLKDDSANIAIVNKKDIKAFAIMSDGMFAKESKPEDLIRHIQSRSQSMDDPRVFAAAAIDYALRVGSRDDKSIQVVMSS